jgi:cobaltochelatase CobT
MAKNPESPLEPFKRALANAARSLAESSDLEIVYSGEGPQLTGHRAVLPHPPRDLTPIDAARIRGFADQMALRIAHHDAAAHAKARPASAMGQPIYDGIEQARIEAIGANALGGVRDNLRAVMEQAWAKRAFNQIEALANPPMADVVSLMVRERLTGEKPRGQGRPRPRPADRGGAGPEGLCPHRARHHPRPEDGRRPLRRPRPDGRGRR